MGMKYYAKSKKKGLSDKERGKQIKEPEEEQKTLNSHQEDIVLKRFLKNMAGIFLKKRNGWS